MYTWIRLALIYALLLLLRVLYNARGAWSWKQILKLNDNLRYFSPKQSIMVSFFPFLFLSIWNVRLYIVCSNQLRYWIKYKQKLFVSMPMSFSWKEYQILLLNAFNRGQLCPFKNAESNRLQKSKPRQWFTGYNEWIYGLNTDSVILLNILNVFTSIKLNFWREKNILWPEVDLKSLIWRCACTSIQHTGRRYHSPYYTRPGRSILLYHQDNNTRLYPVHRDLRVRGTGRNAFSHSTINNEWCYPVAVNLYSQWWSRDGGRYLAALKTE